MKRLSIRMTIGLLSGCLFALAASATEQIVSGLGVSPKANAAAIQRTIDAVAASGGGRVVVPAGTWTTATIYLKSHVDLHLQRGVRLVGSSNLGDYNSPDAFPQNFGSVAEGWSARHLILAIGQTDVAITGEGIVDGNGKTFFGDKPEVFGKTWWREGGVNARDREHQGRPGQLIEFVECRNVRVGGILIEDSPCWSCFFYGCDDVVVHGLRIDNPSRHLNTDGIDIDSCRRVYVRDCRISTGDDAIAVRCAPKRLTDASRICEDIEISGCILRSSADGVRIGVGTGTIRNVRIIDTAIERAGTAFHVQSVFGKSSGVDISEIRFSNCQIRGAARAFEIVGTVVKRPRDIVISNVSVVDVGLVERSLKVVEYADDVRFYRIDVTPADR